MSRPNEQADEMPPAENDRGPYRERRGEDQQRRPAKRLAVVRLIGRVRNADVHHHLIPIASCAERHGSSWRESGGTRVTALIAEVPHEWEVDTCGLERGAAWTGSGEEVRTDPGCEPSLRGWATVFMRPAPPGAKTKSEVCR